MSFDQFVKGLSAADIEFEHLKVAQLAQAILESGRGLSNLFKNHRNPYGMKYRTELASLATSVTYTDSAGETDEYCQFASYDNAVKGYWRFIDRSVYAGWRAASNSPEEFIRFITFAGYLGGPHEQVPPERKEEDRLKKEAYIRKVTSLFGEAEDRLSAIWSSEPPAPAAQIWKRKGVYIDVGHGAKPSGYDPGAVNRDSVLTEHKLNLIAAAACADYLTDAGIPAKVDDSNASNYAAGKAAANYDVLISIHHNSALSRVQGSLALYHVQLGTSADKELARMVAAAMATDIGIDNQGARGQSLDVLRGGRHAQVRAAVLAELYFMHKQTPPDPDPARFAEWSERGGRAIGKAVRQWLEDNA